MSALTVTLGADITALKRAMAGATELVGSSARGMGRLTGAGLAGLGKGGAAALQKGFSVAGTAFKTSITSSRVAEFRPSRLIAFFPRSEACPKPLMLGPIFSWILPPWICRSSSES
jgi:hypothetical protein